MRQNREQLLAKQQILEQYARQQKQLQLQQQQPFQKTSHGIPSSHNNPVSLRSSSMRTSMNSGGLDRVPSSSVPPPGLGNKYDLLPDRPERNYFHRSLSQQHQQQRGSMNSQQYPFGGGSNMNSGMAGNLPQSRSFGDIRMENGGMGLDQGFPGQNERNLYREHFNQLQQDVFSTKY